MLFHDVLCVCFVALLAPSHETNSKTVEPEVLFGDVIKNISRVNDELQNLIKNYEQFKKTHDSQENFDVQTGFASDEGGGRINRNNENYKKKPSDKTTTNSYATEMIYEEEEAEKNSSPKSSEVEESSQVHRSSEVEQSHEEESKKPTENTDKNKQKVQTINTETSNTKEDLTDTRLQYEETGSKSEDFVDIHESMKVKTDRLKRIITEAYEEPNITKYVENEKKTKYLEEKPSRPSESDISSESEQHKEAKEEKLTAKERQGRAFDENLGGSMTGIYLRSRLEENITTTKKPHNGSLELTDTDEDLSKDVFKTTVLREAYGDACLKLVIRKCYKACKSASLTSCRAAIKCKSEFKNYFKAKSKTGCLDAFNASSLRRIPDPNSVDGGIMTRAGYLSVACQTQKPVRRNLENPDPVKNHTESINILRDKYERACAKISQNKCTQACHHALKKTCSKYECRKLLKRNFKKHCKTNCKKFYSNKYKSKSSSSDSDSDDDSDKDSDEDSDEDSDDSDTDSSDDVSSKAKDNDNNNKTVENRFLPRLPY